MAGAIIAPIVSSIIGAGATVGATLGATHAQTQTAQQTNQTNLNFQQSVLDKGEKSFTQAGLPKFMYYGGQSMTSPNTMIHLGGSNFYEGSGVNANLPYFTTSGYQQWNHAGTPRQLGTNRATPGVSGGSTQTGPADDPHSFEENTQAKMPGQTDRVGLGAGRYSAVGPPQDYFNRSAQTDYNFPTDRTTQTFIGSRNMGVGTRPEFTNSRGTQAGPSMLSSGPSPSTETWSPSRFK